MARERVIIGTGKNKVIVTVKRDGRDKRHIFITVPGHMKWMTIWKTLRKLPKHLKKGRKEQKTKLLQRKMSQEKVDSIIIKKRGIISALF